MNSTRRLAQKRKLLLAFDAFDTLFTPKLAIPLQYKQVAESHGIECTGGAESVLAKFKYAFKDESKINPNYGKATDLGAEKWWANVIGKTFQPFLTNNQEVPQALVSDLITRFSTKEGYKIFPDVLPFFRMLREKKAHRKTTEPWNWDRTIVGIITNSDSRVPGILGSFGLKIGPRRVGSRSQRTVLACEGDDISFVVLSYDVGHEKPHRLMFEAAEEMLKDTLAEEGVSPETQSIDEYEKLYVGDSLEKDCMGALRAGWSAALLDRDGHIAEQLDADQSQSGRAVQKGENRMVYGIDIPSSVYVVQNLDALAGWTPNQGTQ